MTKGIKVDPRTKLVIVLCLSTLGIVMENVISLLFILVLSVVIVIVFKVELRKNFNKVKRLIYLIFLIAVIQSIFSPEGNIILSVGRITLLTTGGLEKGLQFILRMVIVIISAAIVTTSSSREIVQGLVQWGLPYDIAFMVALGIRFLPILTEEVKDALIAIQLRGIDIHNIPIKRRISLYSHLFTPILAGTIQKAQRLSITIEMRGFRAYERRTSYLVLKMSKWDYLFIFISITFTFLCFFYYFR